MPESLRANNRDAACGVKLNGRHLKLVKSHGEFVWHEQHHKDEPFRSNAFSELA
jgi:hypothetical protein